MSLLFSELEELQEFRMNSLFVDTDTATYLIRYQILKSVVSRKHTTTTGKVINRNELHPNSIVVYLYQILHVHYDIFWNTEPNLRGLNKSIDQGYLKYLGRGLSKCSDKDRFDKKTGIRQAITNISTLPDVIVSDIKYKILINKL